MKILNNKNILYCAFVDFTQAFDRIEHGLFWFKLFDAGVSTRMCNAIKGRHKRESKNKKQESRNKTI